MKYLFKKIAISSVEVPARWYVLLVDNSMRFQYPLRVKRQAIVLDSPRKAVPGRSRAPQPWDRGRSAGSGLRTRAVAATRKKTGLGLIPYTQ